MNVVGHGIDMIELSRIKDMLDKHDQHFIERCFTQNEQTYANTSPKRTVEIYAARFAAKEAVLKAIGTGWRDGIAWTDIDVTKDKYGAPGIKLAGQAARYADRKGIAQWQISLTHTKTHAMASAIALAHSDNTTP